MIFTLFWFVGFSIGLALFAADNWGRFFGSLRSIVTFEAMHPWRGPTPRQVGCQVDEEWGGLFIGRRYCRTHDVRWDGGGPCPQDSRQIRHAEPPVGEILWDKSVADTDEFIERVDRELNRELWSKAWVDDYDREHPPMTLDEDRILRYVHTGAPVDISALARADKSYPHGNWDPGQ